MKIQTQFLTHLWRSIVRTISPAVPVSLRRRAIISVATLAFIFAGLPGAQYALAKGGDDEHWVGTWGASPMSATSVPGSTNAGFSNQTVRHVAHISVGGERVRVRLSNAYGTQPLVIGAAHIALHGAGASIIAGSDRALTFGGQNSVTIPAGALMLSDPVRLAVPALADLAVSIYVPASTGPTTWHQLGTQTTYISPPGDFTASVTMPIASTEQSRFWLAAVEVSAAERIGAVATIGDSITDGYASTPDANHRWPDYLSQRLNSRPGHRKMAVLNQGISGNRVLHDIFGPNALARFDRDVLSQAGVTHVVVLEGINDLGLPGSFLPVSETVSATEIIVGLSQLAERAHEKGLKIFAGTLTAFEGTVFPGYFTPEKEIKRQAVNYWIRTNKVFDGVIDFDLATRDPANPTRLLPAYDSGDHLHPNDAGYKAMADFVDLALFRNDRD